MRTIRKYIKSGEIITSLDELYKQEFVYVNGKITHQGWFRSWQLRLAMAYLKNGCIQYADRILPINPIREEDFVEMIGG